MSKGLYLIHVSMHGLLQGTQMELGRDQDTGGQVKYVVELTKELITHPDVAEVELITRKIIDKRVSPNYAIERENIAEGANIVRLPCGPNRYIRKESLWPYMDNFADAIVDYLRKKGMAPDLIHGHYADAGYVCSRVSSLLEIPMAFTGHSLGRVKEQRLQAQGMSREKIEKAYNIGTRIEGEEKALDNADFVIASTTQEVKEQYGLYSNYQPKRMSVIPPGVDLALFHPPPRGKIKKTPNIWMEIDRFFHKPEKPTILALSRPDPKKNILSLVTAYAENKELRKKANLLLVLGTREDLKKLAPPARKLFFEIFLMIDRYDLYGSIAIPKRHEQQEAPEIYRYAAMRKGVFVNPALTEPFGLTILEAASSGLPVAVTENGGITETLKKCKNGLSFNPFDTKDMGDVLLASISDKTLWNKRAGSGLKNSIRYYSWKGHVGKYVKKVKVEVERHKRKYHSYIGYKKRFATFNRILVSDIDDTLVGDRESLNRLLKMINNGGEKLGFGIATGRSIALTLSALKEWNIPIPNFLITSVGSEIYYGSKLIKDKSWEKHIKYRWKPEEIKKIIRGMPGIKPQGIKGQGAFKISFFMDPLKSPDIPHIKKKLRGEGINARVIFSHGQYLDIIPLNASKGLAVRHLAIKWGIPFEKILVAGDSGNDIDMLSGNVLGVAVANHTPELNELRDHPRVYFASGERAQGIIEAIERYDFFGEIKLPEQELS